MLSRFSESTLTIHNYTGRDLFDMWTSVWYSTVSVLLKFFSRAGKGVTLYTII